MNIVTVEQLENDARGAGKHVAALEAKLADTRAELNKARQVMIAANALLERAEKSGNDSIDLEEIEQLDRKSTRLNSSHRL